MKSDRDNLCWSVLATVVFYLFWFGIPTMLAFRRQ
jgi:hypothetical protein